MKESITLYHLEREDITINIAARFDEGKLIIDGYDSACYELASIVRVTKRESGRSEEFVDCSRTAIPWE